jgi:T5SS/PEP-CTERM-associated repeat protein
MALLAGSALTFVALPSAVHAAGQDWTGTTNSDWSVGSNWDSLSAPTNGDSVSINTSTPNQAAANGITIDLDGLNVGSTATADGFLAIQTGSAVTVTNNNVVIGGDASGTFTGGNGNILLSSSTLTVTGTPASTGTIFVGASGTGRLLVGAGSAVSTVDSYVGHLQGSNGNVTMSGASTWINSGSSYIGNSGTGVFSVFGGSTVDVTGNTVIGLENAGNGTVTISEAGSSWTTTGVTVLGGSVITPGIGGSGTINIWNGGAYTANDQMFIGLVGTGTVNVTSGGTLTTGNNVFLGYSSGATGTVTISGAGSIWTAGGTTTIVGGNDGGVPVGGNGTVNVLNGATWDTTAGFVVLGNDPSETSRGTVNVSAATWNASSIYVGESGNGTVNIINAATVTADFIIAGDCSCSTGIINVSGGSSLSVASDINLGFDGVGTMNVSGAGTTVTSNDLYLGLGSSGTGTLNVSGLASVTARDLYVGYSGIGTVNVQSGASMTATGNVTIGVVPGANGTVNVSGAGSTLTVNDSIVIGNGGVGTGALNVFDGGTVNVTNFIFNADRVSVGAGSVLNGGFYSATSDATTTFGLRGTSNGRLNVSGTATLDGALVVTGHNVGRTTYTLVSSADLGGTTFSTVTYADPLLRNAVVTYTAGDVLLTVDPYLLSSLVPTANTNQQNVARAIDNAIAAGATPSSGIENLFFLTGDALLNGLTQTAGEPGASIPQVGFAAMGQFINAMMDGPGSGNSQSTGFGGATGFAADDENAYAPKRKLSRAQTEAYAAVTPRDRLAPTFASRWNVWATGYGGNSTINGNAAAGSHSTSTRVYGTAVGADYRATPDTRFGFALGAAGTNFTVDSALGGGRADVFQAGAYARHTMGAAYLAGALAYAWQDITTDRTVTVSGVDKLHAQLKANALSARLEGGWRYGMLPVAVTPYAALQSTAFYLPSYAETATSGSNQFALSYGAKTVTATRSELGARFDKAMPFNDALLTLRGRAAWAHDWNTDRSAIATFQSLPGATFTVNGAQPSANAALLSAGADLAWGNGWTIAATFDGEFSSTTRGYAGKGSLRYAW